ARLGGRGAAGELGRGARELAAGAKERASLHESLQPRERDELGLGDRELESFFASPAHGIVQAIAAPPRGGAVHRPRGVGLAAMGSADDLRDLFRPRALALFGGPADPL